MKRTATALLSGVVFGLGLAISQMTNPAKVLAFFDVAGAWDPSLALVMIGALAVTIPVFRWGLTRSGPILGGEFELPTKRELDKRLVFGAAVYGVGWGLTGLCVGPAIGALAFGDPRVLLFVAALVAGMLVARGVDALGK